jgi:D-alanine-D-alanine ligase-like ATP-grasp enzyme
VIPLNPNQKSRSITKGEQKILSAHNIHNQELPRVLEEYAIKTAKIASEKGLYILGQDWIQDANNRFYCLELNWGPELTSIDAVYNEGKGDDDVTRTIAAEKIAKAIIEDLNTINIF